MKTNLVNENFTDNYVNNLLMARGVKNLDSFFTPTRRDLQPPTNFKNIQIGAALYLRIVMKKEEPYPHILIVVDSDNDGYTSAAIMYQYTKRLNPNCRVDYWLHEGKQHGLQDHIDKLMETNETYDLIILPDSSSNDAHYHDMLDTIHLPCLILDHHLTDVALSDNAIVINNQLSPHYTNKELTGAGVVYQFCRYLDEVLHHCWADDYMDLAAWGIIGDMGSVIEPENRYIIKTGLANVKNVFLTELLLKQSYSITGQMNASWDEILDKTNPISIAFYIVPLVNALIRIGTMDEKSLLFQAFIDGNAQVPCHKRGVAAGTTERAAIEAARVCTNAKTKQNKIKEQAVEKLEIQIFNNNLLDNKILFVKLSDSDDFPPELNGLVAMQLSQKYKMPTIVARKNEQNFIRGSARGLNDSELKDFRSFLLGSGLFQYAQGHANAFGISISNKNYDRILDYANQHLKDIDFGENSYDVNFERRASANDLEDIITDIGSANGIWGQFNSEPIIHITKLFVNPEDINIMGKTQDTVKIESNGIAYMKFRATEFIEELRSHVGAMELEIVGRANLNEWGGRIKPQIFIDDYEIKDFKAPSVTDF